MVRTPPRIFREHLRILADGLHCAGDAEILGRYQAGERDAFAALVHRHGPMVFGVCRRVLGRSADADDAFQATFLALIRNPFGVRNPNALPAWLHRVALRTSRKALARRKPIQPADAGKASAELCPAEQAVWADVRRALDEELNRLPTRFRGPLVLCYLDGATRDEAAARLRLTIGTLDRRLATGPALLRARLSRRGLDAIVLGTAVFADGLDAAVPTELMCITAGLAGPGGSAAAAVHALLAAGPTIRLSAIAAVTLLGGLTATLIGAAGRPAVTNPAARKPRRR
jgi:RNA polymerase sigma factor (sigma-70 family)